MAAASVVARAPWRGGRGGGAGAEHRSSESIDVSAFALEPLLRWRHLRPAAQRAAPIAASPSMREISRWARPRSRSHSSRALCGRRSGGGRPRERRDSGGGNRALHSMRWIWCGAERDGSGRGGGWLFMDGRAFAREQDDSSTWLASVLGRRQAQYMSDLVDMLERERFDEQLRFAIRSATMWWIPSANSMSSRHRRAVISLNLSPAKGRR